MLDALDITEAEAQGLTELAELDLAMARDFARRAQAAEDPEEANRLARSYQRAARSYRQSLALKVRLKRDLAQAAQAAAAVAAAPRPKPGGAAIARRIGELRTALMRLAWDEAERPEAEHLDDERPEWARATGEGGADAPASDTAPTADRDWETFAWQAQDVEGVVAEACLQDSFCDEAADDHVARVALELGFSPAAIARWRELPDPPVAALDARFAFDDPPPRQSSG